MQVDGYSLEAQRERLLKEAKHRGMKVIREFSDEGKSGKNIKGRPDFQRMMDMIQAGTDKVDYVLVFKLSRFGRNAADTLNSLQFMEDFGVNLLCVEDNIDSAGASGKLMISVLAAVAEIERENIKEQTQAGREQKARNGLWNGGQAPYGYKLEFNEKLGCKALVVNEEESSLIRLIFDKYCNTNLGISVVAKWLNDNNYRKKVRQNSILELISASFVKRVLDNPVYMGKIVYGRRRNEKIDGTRNEYHVVKQDADSYELYDGQHEAIISEKDWYYAHEKRSKNAFKREKTHSLEHFHILSGLVKCPVCGGKMYGVVNRKQKKDGSGDFYTDMWYYLCKNNKNQTGTACSFKKHIRQDVVDQEVEAIVKWVLKDSDFRANVLKRVGSSDDLSGLLETEDRLTKELQKLETKKKKLLSKTNALDADDDAYDDLYDDLQSVLKSQYADIKTVNEQLAKNAILIDNAKNSQATMEEYSKILDTILSAIGTPEMPDEVEKEIMNSIIERVDLFTEKQKDGRWVRRIQFKIPLNIDGKRYDTVDIDDKDSFDKNSLPYATNDEALMSLS